MSTLKNMVFVLFLLGCNFSKTSILILDFRFPILDLFNFATIFAYFSQFPLPRRGVVVRSLAGRKNTALPAKLITLA